MPFWFIKCINRFQCKSFPWRFVNRFIYISASSVSNNLLNLQVFFLKVSNNKLSRWYVFHPESINFKIFLSYLDTFTVDYARHSGSINSLVRILQLQILFRGQFLFVLLKVFFDFFSRFLLFNITGIDIEGKLRSLPLHTWFTHFKFI